MKCLLIIAVARQGRNIRGNSIDLVAHKNPADPTDIFKIYSEQLKSILKKT